MIPLGLYGAARPVASGGLVITDSFNRADSTTTLGNTDTGQPWIADIGTWGIVSNAAYLVSPLSTRCHANVEMSTADMAVESRIHATNAQQLNCYPYLIARYVDTNNAYYMGTGPAAGDRNVARRVGGTSTTLHTFTWTTGDLLRLETVEEGAATRINAYRNGSLIYTTLDSTSGRPNGTKAGLFQARFAGTGATFDDFRAETL